MRVVLLSILCCASCLLAISNAPAQRGSASSKPFHTEGVFGNIKAGEGGDYGGMQVYLTDSDGQFYATVTMAEGVLLPPVLVKVKANVEKREVEFELPGGDGARKFAGTVSADALTLTEGGNKLVLKRVCLD
jgi:hypothetical protein